MKILALGPYLGSWREEVFTFRPYIRWIIEVVKYDKVYLCTHLNRVFLYDYIPKENIIPIYQHFSRDEKNQVGYIHNKLNKKDFNLVVKKFKDEIIRREKCNRRDIEIYNLSYSRNTPPVSVYNKIYEPITTDIKVKNHDNNIIYIPCKTDKKDRVFDVYNFLKSCYSDTIVIGDMNTWIARENIVLDQLDYFENGWKYIIEFINKSKAVICPLSYWTGITNLQKKPIFSWGNNPSQYKEDGIYNFGNKKCWIYASSSKTDIKIITDGIKRFLYEI